MEANAAGRFCRSPGFSLSGSALRLNSNVGRASDIEVGRLEVLVELDDHFRIERSVAR